MMIYKTYKQFARMTIIHKPVNLKILLGIGLVLAGFTLRTDAQEFNRINPNYSLMQTNPALASFDNDLKAVLHYRSMYSAIGQNFVSPVINIAVPLFDKSRTNRWGGLGFTLVSDKAGENAYLMNTGFRVSFAYNIKLSPQQSIAAALSAGIFRRSVNTDGFTTGSQYIPGQGYDPNAPLNETLQNQSKSYLDLAAGCIWQYRDKQGKPFIYAGVSAYKLNRPNISFTDMPYDSQITYLGLAGFRLIKRDQLMISPEASVKYVEKRLAYTIGTRFEFPLGTTGKILRQSSLCLTPHYISGNILAFSLELNHKNYAIGFGYEYNPADLKGVTGYLEAYEVMLSLKKNIAKNLTENPDVDSKNEIGKKNVM
jgi:type IX secretion system PorP/SprF family membrane protein